MGGHEKRWWSLNNFLECCQNVRSYILSSYYWCLTRISIRLIDDPLASCIKCSRASGYLFVYSNCLSIFKYHRQEASSGLPLLLYVIEPPQCVGWVDFYKSGWTSWSLKYIFSIWIQIFIMSHPGMVFHTKKGMSYLERVVIIRKVCVEYTLVPCAVVTSDWV